MVDEVRLLRPLRSVTDDLAVLRVEASADDARRADPVRRASTWLSTCAPPRGPRFVAAVADWTSTRRP